MCVCQRGFLLCHVETPAVVGGDDDVLLAWIRKRHTHAAAACITWPARAPVVQLPDLLLFRVNFNMPASFRIVSIISGEGGWL